MLLIQRYGRGFLSKREQLRNCLTLILRAFWAPHFSPARNNSAKNQWMYERICSHSASPYGTCWWVDRLKRVHPRRLPQVDLAPKATLGDYLQICHHSCETCWPGSWKKIATSALPQPLRPSQQ